MKKTSYFSKNNSINSAENSINVKISVNSGFKSNLM